MIFEIHGIRTASGERLIAKVEASSPEHAIARLARRGIVPIQPSSLSEPKTAIQPPQAASLANDAGPQIPKADGSRVVASESINSTPTPIRPFLKRPVLTASLGAIGVCIAAFVIVAAISGRSAKDAVLAIEPPAPDAPALFSPVFGVPLDKLAMKQTAQHSLGFPVSNILIFPILLRPSKKASIEQILAIPSYRRIH